jgi:hypothetical protein
MEGDAINKRHIGILAILLLGAILAACAGSPMAVDQPVPQIAPDSPEAC